MMHPIGIFDSGIGGLTVLKELLKELPQENFVYFGDTARLPYGEKSRETIIRYSIENAIFLLEQNVKVLVVACHTASAYALERLQQVFNMPVIGVIDPGAEEALAASKQGRIAILGTKGTIRSQAYQHAIVKKDPQAFVLPLACPLFVPLVEEHFLDHPATKLIVREYLKPIKEQNIDTILLGCTHYPILRHLICEEVGDQIAIVDPAQACAEQVRHLLGQKTLQKSDQSKGSHSYFVSDDPKKFQMLGSAFLGQAIGEVGLKAFV